MTDNNNDDILKELESIVNAAGNNLSLEWEALQCKLLTASKPVTEQHFDRDPKVRAVIATGKLISQEEFEHDDGAEKVGPSLEDYKDLQGTIAGACRMTANVGLKSVSDVNKFLDEKALICSLYEKTNYVSLFIHVKYSKMDVLAMSTPSGVAVLLDKKDKESQFMYLYFDATEEQEAEVERNFHTLPKSVQEMVVNMAEAQIAPPKMKKESPKMWNLLIAALKEADKDMFADEEDEDEDGSMD